jgi:hypothetical protein
MPPETRLHRAVLCPFHGFTERLVRLGVWSLWIVATPTRHPLTHSFDANAGFPTRRRESLAVVQGNADRDLHRGVQLRRPASRARVYVGLQIRQNHP